ncbi:MAG: ABC transporter permease [Chloroflexota bacterium]|nr:ABC transporter permease [Dehalococcoidia bacterium]MDW8252308.1 ABC transporter permease [Chloroflexota bacterium]
MTNLAPAVPPIVTPARLPRGRGLLSRLVAGLLRNPTGLLGLAIVIVVVIVALFAGQLAPQDPIQQRIVARLRPPGYVSANNVTYLLGTDQYGRDILSRLIFGARVSLSLGFSVVILGTLIGVTMGLVAGLVGGVVEAVVMRVVDALVSVPFLIVAVAVIAVFGPGLQQLIILLTMFVWGQFARLVRGDVLSVKEKEYIEAAFAIGASRLRVAWRHVLPNVISPVIVLATFSVAQLIVAEGALSFLGLGVPPPTPSWGSMLSEGRGYIDSAWWLSVFPGLAITLTVVGVNFLGDALRDIFDPRQHL